MMKHEAYRLAMGMSQSLAISTTSPIGKALVGKKVGDTAEVVTPNGKRELEVLKLKTIHDEAK